MTGSDGGTVEGGTGQEALVVVTDSLSRFLSNAYERATLLEELPKLTSNRQIAGVATHELLDGLARTTPSYGKSVLEELIASRVTFTGILIQTLADMINRLTGEEPGYGVLNMTTVHTLLRRRQRTPPTEPES